MQADPTIELKSSDMPEEDLRKGEIDLIIDFVQVQDARRSPRATSAHA
jgi:hypothetical protein